MTWTKRISATLLLTGAFFVSFASGLSPAEAVTWDYCYSSLRGGGSLAPDNDIATKVQQFRDNGRTVVATGHHYWLNGSGSYRVTEGVFFYFANDTVATRQFDCVGSGGSYADYWNGY